MDLYPHCPHWLAVMKLVMIVLEPVVQTRLSRLRILLQDRGLQLLCLGSRIVEGHGL